MKKYVVFIKHIHSCFASASSNDEWLYKVVPEHKNKVTLVNGSTVLNSGLFEKPTPGVETIEEVDTEDKFITNVYFKADESFYIFGKNKPGLKDYHNTPEFKELIQKYVQLGWSTERPEIENERMQRVRNKQIQQRKKDGFVLWKKYEDLKPEDYKGGFSTEMFNTPHLQKYIKQTPFGYIGHSVRTKHTDRYMEKTLRSLNLPVDTLSLYLTSSSGRHFGDSLEDLTPEEQEEKISNSYNYFHSELIRYLKEL